MRSSALYRTVADATRPFRWRLELLAEALFILAHARRRLARRTISNRPVPAEPGRRESRTLLIVSYYSPPYKSVYGTQRISRFAKYLSRMGWRVVFLTTSPRGESESDASAEALPTEVEVVRIAPIRPHPLRGKGEIPPDDFVYWIPPAVKAMQELLSRRQVSVIMATVPPYSNAVAAAICAKQWGVPLVTDFRDPWTRIDVGWVLRRAWAKRVTANVERLVLKTSARIVMVDQLTDFDEFFVDTGHDIRAKTISILNGYDESDFERLSEIATQARSARRAGKFIISYVGSLYTKENAETLLKVLDAWLAPARAGPDNVVFEYAGAYSSFLDGARNLSLEFKDHGFVSHEEAIMIRARSDVQLFAQPASFKPHVLSGKIYEMIRVGVPVLALTASHGAVARLIELTGSGRVVPPEDPNRAAQVLKGWYDEWKRHGTVSRQNATVDLTEFSRERLTARLDVMLRELCSTGSSDLAHH